MGAEIPSLSKEFKNKSCPADLPMYDSGINPQGTPASLAQVITAAAPHARIVHFADTNHFDPSVRGKMAEQANLDALKKSGFTDIAIESSRGLQHWNNKLVDGALTRPEFEQKINMAISVAQGNEEGQWTRQIGKMAEYARDQGMRLHFADPNNGEGWCDQKSPEAEYERCEKERVLDRYDDTGALGPALRDPTKDKVFLLYGAAHFSLDNGSREAAGGNFLKLDVYKDRQAYEGNKIDYKADHQSGIPTNQIKPDLVYLIDEQRVYTTCQTAPALKQDVEALGPEKPAATMAAPMPESAPLQKPLAAGL